MEIVLYDKLKLSENILRKVNSIIYTKYLSRMDVGWKNMECELTC